jgi:hypothetical protein
LTVIGPNYQNTNHNTVPFALCFQWQNQNDILVQLLKELKELWSPTLRYWGGNEKQVYPMMVYLEMISNDYPDMSQVCTYVLSKTKAKTMHKWGTRTHRKTKVSIRYISSQVPRTSWYSQGARPRHLARPGGLDKTMTTSKTKSSGKTKIYHGTNLQASYCIKMSYHVNYMIKT